MVKYYASVTGNVIVIPKTPEIISLNCFTVPLQPRNLDAKAVSPNEIEVTWDAPEDVDKIVHYTLYYNDSQKHQNGQINIAPPTTRYKLTELVPDTIYHIQLAARSLLGEGARSVLVQARTLQFSKKCYVLHFVIVFLSFFYLDTRIFQNFISIKCKNKMFVFQVNKS